MICFPCQLPINWLFCSLTSWGKAGDISISTHTDTFTFSFFFNGSFSTLDVDGQRFGTKITDWLDSNERFGKQTCAINLSQCVCARKNVWVSNGTYPIKLLIRIQVSKTDKGNRFQGFGLFTVQVINGIICLLFFLHSFPSKTVKNHLKVKLHL